MCRVMGGTRKEREVFPFFPVNPQGRGGNWHTCVRVCVLVSLYSTCTTATASLACAGNSVQGAGALPGCQLKQQQQKTTRLPPPSPSLQTTTTAPSRVLFFKMAGISQPKSRLRSHLFQLRTRELRCVLAGHVSV